ncbi:hypothetical protein GALL_490880 [mine drainage metagenome]|uniref:DUF6701 domain-containing protein n=1 Tax=mine drainage metagenome TaxID=410659 RepID=A0A1J5PCG1_9ZZZZ
MLPYLGALSTASFPAAIAGVATASGFAYGEVGNFTFGTDTVYDDSFTAVDSVKPNPECTPDFSNAANANGMYGCMFGNTGALTVGRFVPDHFTTTPTAAQGCATGGFTYSGQPFSSVRIDALNAAAGNTRNYSTSTGFSKTVTLCGAKGDDGSYNCSGSPAWSVGNATILPTSFLAGNGYYSGATPIISFTAIPTAPSALTLRAHDSDSVSSSGKTEITTNLYSGLLRLTSYTGSATAALQIPVQALYWGGSSWIINNHDSCTVIPSASIALSNYLDSTGAPTGCWTTTGSILGPLSGGHGNIILTTPASTCAGTVGPGSVSVALNLGSSTADTACLPSHPVTTGANEAYLRGRNGSCAASNSYAADPSATATFGIYTPESNKIVHLRELY